MRLTRCPCGVATGGRHRGEARHVHAAHVLTIFHDGVAAGLVLFEAEAVLLAFQDDYQQIATPFEWKFTKSDLDLLLKRLAAREPAPALVCCPVAALDIC
jgi:hypothetical protein